MSLREFRKTKGWTLKRLAEELGCSRAAIGRWEKGEVKPHYGNRRKLEMLGFEGSSYSEKAEVGI